ncbi:MAG: MerR family transcriptional regulator [Actinomycetia bacterium]|nr:MerR family transcriptional regulator [Actinomycetes bacterium]
MTVEELAARTGMSARNIRALQGRGLLPPPLRLGRRAFYLEQHVNRAEAIKDLQRQGFNLFAIGSILGTGDDPQVAEMAALLERVGARDPGLLATLRHHGIVTRTDGTLRVIRPKPIRIALSLRQLGIPVPAAIRMVADILDATEPAAGELLHMVHAGIVENWDRNLGLGLNANPMTRAQVVITLLSETTRVVLDNVGSELMRGVLDPAEAAPPD